MALALRRCMRLGLRRPAFLPISVAPGEIRRHFWNPFASRETSSEDHMSKTTQNNSRGTNPNASDTSQRSVIQHQRIVEKAHRDANLHNERLLDACLDLLRFSGAPATSGGALTMDVLEAETITTLVEVMLNDFRKSPAEQFDLVYAALCLPVTTGSQQLRRCLLVVLEAVLPEALFRVFESVDLVVVGLGPECMERRGVLLRFVHTLLGSVEVPDGLESEEVLLVYLDDVRTAFPQLDSSPAFVELREGATEIAMRAKLYALLSRLCAEFDEENSGKVSLKELRTTAARVLGVEQAELLLQGAQSDAEGKIRYQQLTALLTRPPPRRQR